MAIYMVNYLAKRSIPKMKMMMESFILSPFTIFALLIFFLFIYKRLIPTTTTTTTKSNLPPSPPRLPIIGNLHQLTSCTHRGLFALSRKYGDTMLLHLGSKPVLVVSSASSACHVMKTHDVAFSSRPQYGVFHHVMYDGKDVASAPYGEYWRQVRSVCVLQLLSKFRVKSYSEVRKEEVSLMIEKLASHSGKKMNLSELFFSLLNDIICRAAFGEKYGEKSHFKNLLHEFVVLSGGFYIKDFIPWLGWINHLSGLDVRVKKIREDLNKFLEGVVKEHEDRVDHFKHDEGAKDFVDVLLEFQRNEATGFALERDSIKALLLDAFIAGSDTSSTVLEWSMSELIRHPKTLKILQDEVRRSVGLSLVVTDNHLDKMNYLRATIKESMRLHPPGPLLVPRESTQDVEFSGYTIPAGTHTIINAWAIQRDPTHWSNPEEFRPERFLDSEVDFKGKDFELIPFGSGRRGCPGMSFATTTIELTLASLVLKFDWNLPGGAKPESLDMKEINAITVHRKNPLIVVPTLYTEVNNVVNL